jgi:hypothetical protein
MPKIIAQQHKSHTATARKGWAAAGAHSAAVSAIAVGIDTPHDMAGSEDGNKAAIRRKLHRQKIPAQAGIDGSIVRVRRNGPGLRRELAAQLAQCSVSA